MKNKFKKQRALLTELPGLGKPGALERRPYPPGQHGMRRKKLSDFALRWREKQKLLYNYGLREEQMRRFVREAKRGHGATSWIDKLCGLLECRLDNFVFRAGLAPSVAAARQMVLHGKVYVDEKRVTAPAFIVKPNQLVTLSAKALQTPDCLRARANPRLPIPDWIRLEGEASYRLNRRPDAGAVPFDFERGLVTEYYSNI